jgi:hypothetical protein
MKVNSLYRSGGIQAIGLRPVAPTESPPLPFRMVDASDKQHHRYEKKARYRGKSKAIVIRFDRSSLDELISQKTLRSDRCLVQGLTRLRKRGLHGCQRFSLAVLFQTLDPHELRQVPDFLVCDVGRDQRDSRRIS